MIVNREMVTASANDTKELGSEVAGQLLSEGESGPRIICLYGELGSGKTTFAQGFAKGFGITTRLLSPTFIIVRRYYMPSHPGFLYHLDLYRINSERELDSLGLADMFLDSNSFVIIEWAEKLGKQLPPNRIDIHLAAGNDTHTVKISYPRHGQDNLLHR